MIYTVLSLFFLSGCYCAAAEQVFYDYGVWGERNTMTLQCPMDDPTVRIQIINATAGYFVSCDSTIEQWWTCHTQCYNDVGFDFPPMTIGDWAHARELRACQGAAQCEVTILQLIVMCGSKSLASNYEYIYYTCIDPDSREFSHYDPLPTTPAPHRRPTTTTTRWTHGVRPTKAPYRKKHITLPPKKIKLPPRSTQAPHRSTDATVKLPRKKPTHKTNEKPRKGGVVGGRLKRVQKNGEGTQDAGRNVGVIVGVVVAVGVVLAAAIAAFVIYKKRRRGHATRPVKQTNIEDLNPYEEIKEENTTAGNNIHHSTQGYPRATPGDTDKREDTETTGPTTTDSLFTKSNTELENDDQEPKPSTSQQDEHKTDFRPTPTIPEESNDSQPSTSPAQDADGQNTASPEEKTTVRQTPPIPTSSPVPSPTHKRGKSYAKPYSYDMSPEEEVQDGANKHEIKYAQLDHTAPRNGATPRHLPTREKVTYADIKLC